MGRFISRALASMSPYIPGEQPLDKEYIKLNTNENPYPPSPEVRAAIASVDTGDLRLYPDHGATDFRNAVADYYGLKPEQIFAGGGSDEVLAYSFIAFFDRGDKVYFPDITYGFYKVYADLFELNSVEVQLKEDFTIGVGDYFDLDGNIFIANPNAPTGICLDASEIEKILAHNQDRLVIIDEAYIDFASGKSCVNLIDKYDNLLVVRTFSKSRGLAGMRLGIGLGNPDLIEGLERVKFSFNPYNLDRVSLAAGAAAVSNDGYMKETVAKIIKTRERVKEELLSLGFQVLPSDTNFLFAKKDGKSGAELCDGLKQNGVLVRHFVKNRIDSFLRITIGTDEEMDVFLEKLRGIL